jgi:integrase
MVAEQLLQKMLGEIGLGLPVRYHLKKLRYETIRQALLDEYANQAHHSLITFADGTKGVWGMKHLDNFFCKMQVAAITTDALRAFIRMRQSEGAEPSTINRNVALLRRMFKLAQRDGKIQVAPYFPMLPENEPRRGFIEPTDFDILLKALAPHLRPIVMFLYGSGARIGEARKIRWNQVDLTTAEIRLQDNQTKNGEPRILPLSADLVGVLKKTFRTEGPVFCTTDLRRAWQDASVAAGFGEWEKTPKLKKGRMYRGLLIHDLRRSAVRT